MDNRKSKRGALYIQYVDKIKETSTSQCGYGAKVTNSCEIKTSSKFESQRLNEDDETGRARC